MENVIVPDGFSLYWNSISWLDVLHIPWITQSNNTSEKTQSGNVVKFWLGHPILCSNYHNSMLKYVNCARDCLCFSLELTPKPTTSQQKYYRWITIIILYYIIHIYSQTTWEGEAAEMECWPQLKILWGSGRSSLKFSWIPLLAFCKVTRLWGPGWERTMVHATGALLTEAHEASKGRGPRFLKKLGMLWSSLGWHTSQFLTGRLEW